MKKMIGVLLMLIMIMAFTSCSEACDESVGENVPKDKIDVPVDDFAEELNPDRNYLIVVNEDNPYNFDGKYAKSLEDDLTFTGDYDGVPRPLERATYSAFGELKKHLFRSEDIEIALVGGYRDKVEQRMVNEGYYLNLPEGKVEFSDDTKPGLSEYHTGLLLKFAVWDGEWEMDSKFVKDEEFSVIWKSLPDYGFIVRYPKGKKEITGRNYDPYEIRFVGSSKMAHEIMDNGLCLDEFEKFNGTDKEDKEKGKEDKK